MSYIQLTQLLSYRRKSFSIALRINVRSTDELNKIWSRLIHALLYAQYVSNESGTILHARKKPPPIFVVNI